MKKRLLQAVFILAVLSVTLLLISGCSAVAGGADETSTGAQGSVSDDTALQTSEEPSSSIDTEPAPSDTQPPSTSEPAPSTSEQNPSTSEQAPSTSELAPSTSETPYFPGSPTVCIDAGHGFTDPGAVVSDPGGDIYESDLNMQIALKLREALLSLGYNVIMTHNGVDEPDDKYLADTLPRFDVNMRNRWIRDRADEIDLVISVHCNTFSSASASGSRYYILPTSASGYDPESYTLMANILKSVTSALSLPKEPTWSRQSLAVLATDLPSVLIECGFMTNPGDLEKLTDPEWQAKYAAAIADGIRNYLKS